jgi:hypothetical protein
MAGVDCSSSKLWLIFWHLHPTGGFLTRFSFNPSFKASLDPEDVRDEKVKAWST